MRLADLDPVFYGLPADGGYPKVDTLAEAHAVRFQCPCGSGHWLVIPLEGRAAPGQTAKGWGFSGASLDDLTLTPSLAVRGGNPDGTECWHGFITAGAVVNA